MNRRIGVGVLCVMLLHSTHGISQTQSSELDPARRAYIASRLYQATYQYFAHWGDVAGLDVDAEYMSYLREALSAPDRRSFSLASQAFLVSLGNGHTRFVDNSLFEDAGGSHGYRVRYLSGEWTVIESYREGLRPGDVIEQIDGVPAETYYDDHKRYINASTERYRRRALFYSWNRFLFPLKYLLTVKGGRTIEIDRSVRADTPPLETRGQLLEGGSVAYIQVPSWNEPRFQERAMELLREYVHVPSLIVDVRGNNGGTTPIKFITALMERPWKWWTGSTPMTFSLFSYNAKLGRPGFSYFERPSMIWSEDLQEGDSLYSGMVVILVDEGTHSASEDFSQPFKENGRGTIIGNLTAGSTGQPYSEDLGEGLSFRIGAKREHFPDGGRFEGIGIEPDILVVPVSRDYRENKDPELDLALEYIRKTRRQ